MGLGRAMSLAVISLVALIGDSGRRKGPRFGFSLRNEGANRTWWRRYHEVPLPLFCKAVNDGLDG